MTNFTDNYLERLMRQKPLPDKRKDKAGIESSREALPEQPSPSPLDAIPALVAKLQNLGSESRCVKYSDLQ